MTRFTRYAKREINFCIRNYPECETDILLTTDIKFLKGCQRIKSGITVKNPVKFIMEVCSYDEIHSCIYNVQN